MTASFPSFHDGKLTGVILQGKHLSLLITSVTGEHWKVSINEVVALCINDFREGNIILDCEIVQRSKPDRKILENLFPGPHTTAARHFHELYDQSIAAKSGLIEHGLAALLVVTPSYGAELAVMCSEILAEQIPK